MIVLQFILVKRFFLEERCNKSSFENLGKTPEDREELTRAVREGRRMLRHFTSRGVGIGSS